MNCIFFRPEFGFTSFQIEKHSPSDRLLAEKHHYSFRHFCASFVRKEAPCTCKLFLSFFPPHEIPRSSKSLVHGNQMQPEWWEHTNMPVMHTAEPNH